MARLDAADLAAARVHFEVRVALERRQRNQRRALAGLQAVLGAAIAYAGVRAFLALTPGGLPRAATIAIDTRVLLFAAGVGILTAIVFGLMPALRLASGGSGDPLRDSGRSLTGTRGAQRLRSALIVGEVAISLVLVAQAGWLMRSFIRMTRFLHACAAIRNRAPVNLTRVAHDCGYYDQSHFIHDFKSFSGYNPGIYFSGKAGELI